MIQWIRTLPYALLFHFITFFQNFSFDIVTFDVSVIAVVVIVVIFAVVVVIVQN